MCTPGQGYYQSNHYKSTNGGVKSGELVVTIGGSRSGKSVYTTQMQPIKLEETWCLLFRSRHLINTDPQHRCYNGAHAKSELIWDKWELLDTQNTIDEIESRFNFWRSLNDYAVSQRGEVARSAFKIVRASDSRIDIHN